ncbi:hypothetical protein T190130A13A_30270 [Tenacibaculum sp. 190130A14a]|uniref:Uncharacterized protein n=1 Tax=Tenacibaculum polynesiense TaxID=3137857 RepID=A0ABM9PC26_9FLAO
MRGGVGYIKTQGNDLSRAFINFGANYNFSFQALKGNTITYI